jgi:hypothetical protein
MFWVNDTIEERHARIRSFLNREDRTIAVLLAAANFEWIVRRAIIALGHSPNADIRVRLVKCYGLDSYKKIWKAEVGRFKGVGLASVVPNWRFFKEKAFPLRHKIVHGEQGSTGREFATERVEAMLMASSSIAEFALQHSLNLYQRLPVRRRVKSAYG